MPPWPLDQTSNQSTQKDTNFAIVQVCASVCHSQQGARTAELGVRSMRILLILVVATMLASCAVRTKQGMSFEEFESRCASKYLTGPTVVSRSEDRAIYICVRDDLEYVFEGGTLVEKRKVPK